MFRLTRRCLADRRPLDLHFRNLDASSHCGGSEFRGICRRAAPGNVFPGATPCYDLCDYDWSSGKKSAIVI